MTEVDTKPNLTTLLDRVSERREEAVQESLKGRAQMNLDRLKSALKIALSPYQLDVDHDVETIENDTLDPYLRYELRTEIEDVKLRAIMGIGSSRGWEAQAQVYLGEVEIIGEGEHGRVGRHEVWKPFAALFQLKNLLDEGITDEDKKPPDPPAPTAQERFDRFRSEIDDHAGSSSGARDHAVGAATSARMMGEGPSEEAAISIATALIYMGDELGMIRRRLEHQLVVVDGNTV